MENSALFRLPRELREQIYDYAFTDKYSDTLLPQILDLKMHYPGVALIATCRQIHVESI